MPTKGSAEMSMSFWRKRIWRKNFSSFESYFCNYVNKL